MRSYFCLLFLISVIGPASVQALQSKDEDLYLDENGTYLDYTWEMPVKSASVVTSEVCGVPAEFSWKQIYKEPPNTSNYIQAPSLSPVPIPEFELELKLDSKNYQTGFISAFLKRKTKDYVGMRILGGVPFCSQAFKAKKIWGVEITVLFFDFIDDPVTRAFHFVFQDEQPIDVYESYGL